MFRLIALCLVTTFALLAFLGAGADGPSAQRGELDVARMSDRPTTPAPGETYEIQPGARYLTESEIALLRHPEPGAEVVARIYPGVPLVLVAPAESDFARVTAENGQTGYVLAGALAPTKR